jgi:hypothetical protein
MKDSISHELKDLISYEMKNSVADKTYSLGVFTYKLKWSCIVAVVLLCNFMLEVKAEPDILQTRRSSAMPQHSPAPGLFQRLIKIKYSSELYLIIKAKEAAKLNKPEMVDSALAVYNNIRWNLDGLVYQLSGDLVAANSPKNYKQINQWCLYNFEGEAIAAAASESAAQSIESIESLCELYLPSFSLISEMSGYNSLQLDTKLTESIAQNNPDQNINQQSKNINLTTNVFYLIKDSYSIIKGLSDLKTQKTMALVDILDQMRLASPQELLKQVK